VALREEIREQIHQTGKETNGRPLAAVAR
jgi:hypothetical protein